MGVPQICNLGCSVARAKNQQGKAYLQDKTAFETETWENQSPTYLCSRRVPPASRRLDCSCPRTAHPRNSACPCRTRYLPLMHPSSRTLQTRVELPILKIGTCRVRWSHTAQVPISIKSRRESLSFPCGRFKTLNIKSNQDKQIQKRGRSVVEETNTRTRHCPSVRPTHRDAASTLWLSLRPRRAMSNSSQRPLYRRRRHCQRAGCRLCLPGSQIQCMTHIECPRPPQTHSPSRATSVYFRSTYAHVS